MPVQLLDLPTELLAHIVTFLDVHSRAAFSTTCTLILGIARCVNVDLGAQVRVGEGSRGGMEKKNKEMIRGVIRWSKETREKRWRGRMRKDGRGIAG